MDTSQTQKVRIRMYVKGAKEGHTVELSRDQLRHLKVLRMKTGQIIQVFDGVGGQFEAKYPPCRKQLLLGNKIKAQKEPKIKIILAIACPKGPRLDFLIEKVSELGVSEIVPVICKRSVVKPRASKIERLRKISIEACAQSGRSTLPLIHEPVSFGQALHMATMHKTKLICHKTGQSMGKIGSKSVFLLVGPEGDFTPEELEATSSQGFQKVSLGHTILRVESAGIAAVAQIVGNSL